MKQNGVEVTDPRPADDPNQASTRYPRVGIKRRKKEMHATGYMAMNCWREDGSDRQDLLVEIIGRDLLDIILQLEERDACHWVPLSQPLFLAAAASHIFGKKGQGQFLQGLRWHSRTTWSRSQNWNISVWTLFSGAGRRDNRETRNWWQNLMLWKRP